MTRRYFVPPYILKAFQCLSIALGVSVAFPVDSHAISRDPIVAAAEDNNATVVGMCLVDGPTELSAEEQMATNENAEKYKKARDKNPPEGKMTIVIDPNCGPSTGFPDKNKKLKSKYQGIIIDCKTTPNDPACIKNRPTIIIELPGPPQETITIEGKTKGEAFLDALAQ